MTLAVGRHIRLPRSYRGSEIMAWFDSIGVLSEPASQVWDLDASRRQPSLQLIGSEDHRSLDLNILQEQGVRIVGRAIGADRGHVYLADDWATTIWNFRRKSGHGAFVSLKLRACSISKLKVSALCCGRQDTAANTPGCACRYSTQMASCDTTVASHRNPGCTRSACASCVAAIQPFLTE